MKSSAQNTPNALESSNSELVIKRLEQKLADFKKEFATNTEARMQNYFDCQDDYSWGGLCDQAQSEELRSFENMLKLMKEQEANGGYLIRKVSELSLYRKADNNMLEFCTKKIVNGKFGPCFMYGEYEKAKFCSLAKNQKTFEKKGYMVEQMDYELIVRYTGRLTAKGNPICNVEIKGLTKSFPDKIDTSIMNDSYFLYVLNTNNQA